MAIITISLPAGKGSPGLLMWFQGRPLRLGQKVGPEVESWGERLQTWEAQWEKPLFRTVVAAKGMSVQRLAKIFEVTPAQADRWLSNPQEIKGSLSQFFELGEDLTIDVFDLDALLSPPQSPPIEPPPEPPAEKTDNAPFW